MKFPFCSVLGLSLILASCSSLDPEYAEYKRQKEAEAAAASQSPYGRSTDPYGIPGGAPGSETGAYAPYQPLPGVNDPLPSPTPSFPNAPAAPTAPPAAGATTSHVVAKGDSLWGLARRYNTSIEAIRAANGIPAGSNTIQAGQTLQIPSP